MIDFKIVSQKSDLDLIAQMAQVIWHEHYTPIIGKDQVLYMLEKFQSSHSMLDQIKNGYIYVLINLEGKAVGYLAYERRDNAIFLSKIYILKEARGKGFGKQAMDYVFQRARDMECESVQLTVNRYNIDSIKAYERSGFQKTGELIQDIGNGFVMDDYAMEKKIATIP